MANSNLNENNNVIEGLSNDIWNPLDFRLLTYVKSPIQLYILNSKTALIGRILCRGIVDLLDYLTENLNDYLTDSINVLGTENRSYHSKRYTDSLEDNSNNKIEIEMSSLAPNVFYQIREDIGLSNVSFRQSFSQQQLKDFTNPGKSGSLMYKTSDDLFLLKTLREYEARLLLQILSGYHLQLKQRSTIFNRYIGLYSLHFPTIISSMEIYIVVMINAFPCSLKINEIFDLKGSTIKRKLQGNISKEQLHKLKDLDFKDLYPHGIQLPKTIYDRLHLILSNDVKILKKLHITDFSLILGIRHLDVSEEDLMQIRPSAGIAALFYMSQQLARIHFKKQTLQVRYSTDSLILPICYLKPMEMLRENIDTDIFYHQDSLAFHSFPIPGIINQTNQRVYIYLALIDILQTYDYCKCFEQTLKKLKNPCQHLQYSVVEPEEYEKRFLKFLFEHVFINVKMIFLGLLHK